MVMRLSGSVSVALLSAPVRSDPRLSDGYWSARHGSVDLGQADERTAGRRELVDYPRPTGCWHFRPKPAG